MSRHRSVFNLGLVIKIIILLGVIMLGLFVYLTCSGQSCLIQKIDKTLPDIAAVPYQVTTVTHLYLAVTAVKNTDASVTMSNWYERLNGKWVLHKETVTLPKIMKPDVIRR